MDDLGVVVFPDPPRNFMAAQVKSLEVDACNLELLQNLVKP